MNPKAFISYCRSDQALAKQLKKDLSHRGCDSWQFDLSAVPGTDAWDVILERIEKSDYFVALISRAAILSPGVQEEISHAHYCSINNPEKRPRMIPLILEDGVVPPRQIVRSVWLSFRESQYNSDFERLLSSMGIEESPFASAKELDVTFSRGREFDVEAEARAYVSNLIANHPEVSVTFNQLSKDAQDAAAGRWRMPSPKTIVWEAMTYRGAVQPQYWRRAEYKILVFLPLHCGYSSGYESNDRVVVEVSAFQDLLYDHADDGNNLVFHSDTLQLKFDGFRNVTALAV